MRDRGLGSLARDAVHLRLRRVAGCRPCGAYTRVTCVTCVAGHSLRARHRRQATCVQWPQLQHPLRGPLRPLPARLPGRLVVPKGLARAVRQPRPPPLPTRLGSGSRWRPRQGPARRAPAWAGRSPRSCRYSCAPGDSSAATRCRRAAAGPAAGRAQTRPCAAPPGRFRPGRRCRYQIRSTVDRQGTPTVQDRFESAARNVVSLHGRRGVCEGVGGHRRVRGCLRGGRRAEGRAGRGAISVCQRRHVRRGLACRAAARPGRVHGGGGRHAVHGGVGSRPDARYRVRYRSPAALKKFAASVASAGLTL